MDFYNKKKGLITTVFLTTALFLTMYNSFIFFDYNYISSGDATSTYFPIFKYFKDTFPDFTLYDLNLGLGGDINTILYYFITPFSGIFLLFSLENLQTSMIWYVLLQILTISIFCYKYFDLILKKTMSKIAVSLMWTFSGFILVWGRHYQFITWMVYFTIALFIWQKILFGENKYKYLFVLFILLFSSVSIYLLYPAGIFLAIYTIFYMNIQGYDLRNIIGTLFNLLYLAVLGMLIGCIFIIPWLDLFLESNRLSSIKPNLKNLLTPLSIEYILLYISRLFSNNLMSPSPIYLYGLGMPLLSSSLLAFPSVFYFIANTKTRKKTLQIFLIVCIALLFPISNYIFLISNEVRWTWIVIFVNILCIGFFLDGIDKHDKKLIDVSFIITALILSLLVIIEWLNYSSIITNFALVRTNIVKAYLLLLLLYLYYMLFNGSFKVHKINKLINYNISVIFLVVLELVIINFSVVDARFFKAYQKNSSSLFYNEQNLIDSIDYIKELDSSLYRISNDYTHYHMANTPTMLKYNGTSNYNSLTSKFAYDFVNTVGNIPKLNHINRYNISSDNYVNSLIGVKYFILNREVDSNKYVLINKFGNKYVYLNTNYLPFGYVYYNQYEKLQEIDTRNKNVLLSRGFYFTQQQANSYYIIIKPNMDFSYGEPISLFDKISTFDQLEYYIENDVIYLEATGNDPKIIVDLKEIDYSVGTLNLSINSSDKDYMFQIFYGNTEYSEKNSSKYKITKGHNSISIPINNKMDNIRIDPMGQIGSIQIESMNFVNTSYEQNYINKNIQELRKVSIENAEYKNSTLTGFINNTKDIKGMMCIPLIYSDKWKASLNGQRVETYNINGGLVGIELPPGEYNIELKYVSMPFEVGKWISIVSLSVYIVYGVFIWRKKYYSKTI